MEALYQDTDGEPSGSLSSICAAFGQAGGKQRGESINCPAVYVILGIYLERTGFDEKEISRGVSSIRESAKKHCAADEIACMMENMAEYLRKHMDPSSRREETRVEKPSQYYKGIYEDREQMFRHFPYSLEEKLTRAVMAANEPAALQTFKEINDTGSKAELASDTVRSAKNSVICSCVLLTRAAIQAGVAPDEAFSLSDAVIKHIEDFSTRWDVLHYEEDVLMLFIALIKRSVHDTVSLTTRRTIRFIDANLSGKLSLPQIAAHVGVNQNYLSGLFRREMNMRLSDYISRRKVQESVYFVKYTDYSMADIALLYGFSSQSYYTSVFRKVIGMTPAAYRAGAKKSKDG